MDLVEYKPQRSFLSLINLADKTAVMSWKGYCQKGNSVWKMKDKIDKKFIYKYSNLPEIPQHELERDNLSKNNKLLPSLNMRCKGCGGKVSGVLLNEVLTNLDKNKVTKKLQEFTDVSIQRKIGDNIFVESVDFFSSFIEDWYTFGKIAANHCLNDIFAVGAKPEKSIKYNDATSIK